MSEAVLPQPGDLFANRYRIAHLLGQGGFGAVYQARDTSLERDVAIKVLARTIDAQALARFLQEAKAAASLASEHVATVYEVGSTGDGPYLVMELLRGCDLQDELDDRTRLPVAEAVDHVLQAALGIAHAHARGIVHRDLKPRNLFLAQRDDGTRVIKILDFGIAKSTATDLTQTGATLGTPRYMAPEQLRTARTVDARTDVWALGVVLYELVTGKAIFDGDTATQLAVSIVIDAHVKLRARDPELPAELEAVIDRCLEKDPGDRFPDVHQLAAALAPLATDAGRALVPRVERALGDRASGAIARSAATATAETLEVTPAQASARTIASGDAATQLAGTPTVPGRGQRANDLPPTELAAGPPSNTSNDPRPSGATEVSPRSRRTVVVAILVAAAAIAVAVVMWVRGRPEGGTSSVTGSATTDGPVVGSSATDGPATADGSILPPEAAPPPDAVVVLAPADAQARDAGLVADAARRDRPVRPPVTATPSQAEIDAIAGVCVNGGGPTFAAPNNDGPRVLQCERMALLGCAGLARACKTAPVTDDERLRCRDFLSQLQSRQICR